MWTHASHTGRRRLAPRAPPVSEIDVKGRQRSGTKAAERQRKLRSACNKRARDPLMQSLHFLFHPHFSSLFFPVPAQRRMMAGKRQDDRVYFFNCTSNFAESCSMGLFTTFGMSQKVTFRHRQKLPDETRGYRNKSESST